MSKILNEVLEANQNTALSLRKGESWGCRPRAVSPSSPAWTPGSSGQIRGLAEGDAHGVRNAGGRASDDAIRWLVISSSFSARSMFVIHHTNCGMEFFSDTDARSAGEQPGHRRTDSEGFRDVGAGSRLTRGRVHRLADHQGSATGGDRRCRTHSQPSAGPGVDSGARIYLRRSLRETDRGRVKRKGGVRSNSPTACASVDALEGRDLPKGNLALNVHCGDREMEGQA